MAMKWETLLCSERPRLSSVGGDHRAEFERDLDRAMFSTPVKRLQDKTQVFPLEPIDAIRTRLTHSLEVSAVARGFGIKAGQWLLNEGHIKPGMDRAIEAICATCGLIHDLGNPPFGHSGEDAIRHWFTSRFGKAGPVELLGGREQLVQDFLKFEGNAQSLRLVTKLQILADFNGLNLTFGTLSASCKYIAASHQVQDKKAGDHAMTKPGYFASEEEIVQLMRSKTGTGDSRNPLTFLVEAADDLVYSVADVEDAVKKGVFPWHKIDSELRNSGDPSAQEALTRCDKILKAGASALPKELPDDVFASAFRTAVIGIVVESAFEAFQGAYDSIMKGGYKSELVADCTASPLVARLKEIGGKFVYCTASNLKLELMGRRVIGDLMDIFWEGAQTLPTIGNPKTRFFDGKAGALLSENYRRVFQHSVATMPKLPENYHRLQLVTDYVSGMTDTFAKRLHTELMNG